MKRPPKISDVLKNAHQCVKDGRYFDTSHAIIRRSERRINLTTALYVIMHGYHEKQKDQYKPEFDDWNYSIRGQSIDGRDIRIAIAFDEDGMLIITVIEISRGAQKICKQKE